MPEKIDASSRIRVKVREKLLIRSVESRSVPSACRSSSVRMSMAMAQLGFWISSTCWPRGGRARRRFRCGLDERSSRSPSPVRQSHQGGAI